VKLGSSASTLRGDSADLQSRENVFPNVFRGASATRSILYLGSASLTSLHRTRALMRLGYAVEVIDPHGLLPRHKAVSSWNHHTGALLSHRIARSRILGAIGGRRFDLVWVDGGDLVSPELVRDLKKCAEAVVNYSIDDPFGNRDGLKWRLYRQSVREYDLVAVVRAENVAEAHRAGAKAVLRVYMSFDEVAHAGRELTESDRANWKSEVLFVGTWMPERGPFLARLIQLGVPLTIRGDRWNRAKEWPQLKLAWRSTGVLGDDYARAIQCAKVSLCLLSKGNRDLHTTRSMEIPALNGLLCAERTREHEDLYLEDEEAVFWSSADECAEKCSYLLRNEAVRRRIANRGHARALANQISNQCVMAAIIEAASNR